MQFQQGYIHWVNNNTLKINLLAKVPSPECTEEQLERRYTNILE